MSYDETLLRLEAELDIPYPERREVIAELRAHIEALHEDLCAQGCPPEQAEQKTLAALALDREFLASMATVHQSAVARALARLPRRVSLGIEYGGLLVIACFLMISLLHEEVEMVEFFFSGGFFMIPLNLAGAAILVLGLERVYSLYIKRDHSSSNLDKRLLSLKFLAVACALTGVVGTLTGLYSAFAAEEVIRARLGGEFPVFEVVAVAMTTSIWGLTLALSGVIFRFVAEAKASRIRAMHGA